MASTSAPRYRLIKQALMEEIDRGVFKPDRPFITEREICSRFEVSRPTAIRALNELVHEGVLTRHRGRGTFVAERSARKGEAVKVPHRPADGGSRLVACIMASLYGEYTTTILRGIEHMCHEADFHLLLLDSREDPRTEARNVQRARDAGVAALIVYPVGGYTNDAVFEALRRDGFPLVMVDRYYPSVPTDAVVVDNLDVGRRVTGYLIDQGHRHIAFIPGHEVAITSVQDRLSGYRLALRERGLPLQPELAVLRPFRIETAESDRALLASWLAAPYRPTAYVGVNSGSLVVVARELLSLGMAIPGEVAFAAMDNVSLDPLVTLTVAKAVLPSYEIGSTAMRVVLGRLAGAGGDSLQHVMLPAAIATAAAGSLSAVAT